MKKFTFAGVMIGLLVAGPLSAAGEMVADDGRLERRMPTVNGSRAAMDFPGHPGSERRLDGFMLSEGDVTTDMQPVLEPFRATDDSVENVFDPIQQPDQRRMQKQFTGGDWSQDGARHGQAEVRTGPAGSDEGAAKTFIRPDALPKDLFAPGVQELMRDQQFAVPGKSGSELDMESLQEKGRTEPRVAERSVPSPLERQVGADELLSPSRTKPANLAKNIQQFGYSFFRETKFAADRNLPVTADYLLAPGDTLVVTVWGAVNGTYEVPINRSGEVAIPKVGPVKLAGLPFGSVRDVLKNRLASIYRNFDLSVNMGRLRTIKVYVVGEVAAPGDYSVSGLGTVINALGAAGGPTKNGSLRNIKVRRAAGGEEPVDLYDFFTNGDKSRDIRLQSGDTIFVPVIGRVVAVAGNVKRPAIYELKHEQTLKEVLSLAEGITATGNLQQVQISRTEANAKKSVIDLNLDPLKAGKPLDELAAAVKINDLDVVRVYGISGLLRGHVKISGHVERQGYYAIAPGQRISGVLAADNLLPEYHTELLEITRLVPPDLHREKLLLKLSAALAKDPAHDIELKEFDTLRVFSRWDLEERLTVRVNGEVQQPGQYRHYSGMTVRDLLVQAGNPKASAFLKNAEISRLSLRNERAQMEPITINLDEVLKGDPAHNLVLAPFDELNVRRIPNWATEKDRYVKLSGEFVFPGTYPIYRGERLSSVIARAGGFTDKAYLPGAKYTREIVRKLQQQRLDESLQKAQEEVVRKQSSIMSVASSREELEATKATLDALEKSIQLLRVKKAEGRVVISLRPEAFKGSIYDVEVEGGDSLVVPSDPASVNVLGSVYNPITALYEPSRSISHYLDMVGGVTNDGAEGDIYLVKADGTVISRQQSTSFLFFDTFGFKAVESGDTIVVPQKIERTAWLRDIKDITTILSQVAISAGTVFLGLR